MRGSLNLSRLQTRGRAAETSYFTNRQKEAAVNLRAKLTPSELASLKKESSNKATTPQTIDTLSEISAHSTYDRIIHEASTAQPAVSRSGILSSWKDPKNTPRTPEHLLKAKDPMFDPTLLRALGQSRFSIAREHMQKIQEHSVAHNPNGKIDPMGEGAVLGAGAFGIASAIVGGVGAVGLGYLYLHQEVIDGFRSKSVALRGKLDESLGVRLRRFSDGMKEKGGLISPETSESAREFARSSIGFGTGRRGS